MGIILQQSGPRLQQRTEKIIHINLGGIERGGWRTQDLEEGRKMCEGLKTADKKMTDNLINNNEQTYV